MPNTQNQTWNPEQYARNARFVADLAMPVVEWLAPVAGERILDLGCGDGHLTAKLADLGCHVTGIDSSPEFVDAAIKAGVEAHVMKAQEIDREPAFVGAFDAVFSNATLHWVHPPEAAIAAAYRVLKPRGRFVGEFGGAGCVAEIRQAMGQALARRGLDIAALDPWFFPTAEEYRSLLQAQGFEVLRCEVFPRPTALPHSVKEWIQTFGLCFLSALPQAEREAFLDEVTSALRPKLCDERGKWTADYTRLRFAATRLD